MALCYFRIEYKKAALRPSRDAILILDGKCIFNNS